MHPRCRCLIKYLEVGSIGGREPLFFFDIQRFGTYEEQVASHGGSDQIKPDRVIEGHERTPSKTEPLSIIDHKDYKGAVDAKNHPYGERGEHAHDIKWAYGKAQRATRDLSVQERKDNGDIL